MTQTQPSPQLNVPPEMLRYILYQKTKTQHPIGKLLWKMKLGKIYDKVGIPLLERPRFGAIADDFQRRCGLQFEDIQPYLPPSPRCVLDVGCGIGGVDALLNKHYGNPKIDFYLLDKSGMSSEVFYGLTDEGAHYNSADLTRRFLLANEMMEDQVHLVDVAGQPFPVDVRFDLIVSFISWGFHYAIDTYLDETAQTLSEEGVMILDIRKGSDAIDTLLSRFSQVKVVATTHAWSGKWDKVLIRK